MGESSLTSVLVMEDRLWLADTHNGPVKPTERMAVHLLPLLAIWSASECPADLIGVRGAQATHITGSEICTFSVSYCTFVGISGTAVAIQQSQSIVVVSNCAFDSCTNTVNKWGSYSYGKALGGACYFNVQNSTVEQCCGTKCSATYRGQFYQSDCVGWHVCRDVCTLACGSTESDSQDVIQIMQANRTLERLNCSSNSLPREAAAFELWLQTNSVSLTYISQISVVNCRAKGLMILSSAVSSECSMFSIINNTITQGANSSALICFVFQWRISNLFIFGNSANQITRRDKTDFSQSLIDNSFMTLVDCVSDAEITGDYLELVNHTVDASAIQTHDLQVLACFRYLVSQSFTSTRLTTRHKVAHLLIFRGVYMVTVHVT